MKILHINCVYGKGSTGRIVADLIRYGNNSGLIESFALYGRGEKDIDKCSLKISSEFEAKVHSFLSRCTGQHFAYSPISTNKIIRFINEYSPDVVHLHCLNGNFVNVYKLLDYLKKKSIKTILTLHAEIMHTSGCEHAFDCVKWKTECKNCDVIRGRITSLFRDDAKYAFYRMKRAFANFKDLTIVGVSDWLTERAKQSGVFKDCYPHFATVYNGCDLESFKPTDSHSKFRPQILHVTPNFKHPLKGGKYVIELARLKPEWDFLIVGYNSDEPINLSNVKTIGNISNKQELAQLYSSSNVTLLTSSRETFSMVCLESLACGTPVVGFKAGGPESVFSGEACRFVNYGDLKSLINDIDYFLQVPVNINRLNIVSKFSSENMFNKYLCLYKNQNVSYN